MNLQQLSAIVTHTTELICVVLHTSYESYSYYILLATCFWAWQKYLLFSIYWVQYKNSKMNLQKILFIGRNLSQIPHTHTHSHTHTPNAKTVIFGFRGPQNVQIHQNLHFENLAQKQCFLHHTCLRESNDECNHEYSSLLFFATAK